MSDSSFFKGIDLSFNPYFKDTSLKNLFILNKPASFIEKCLDKIPTRFITFLSLEKTGVSNEGTLCSFVNTVFISCPHIEILILNSLPITDKVGLTLAVSIQNAAQHQLKLVRNLKEIGLSNTKISDKSSIKLMFALLKHTLVEVINFECNQGIGFNTASFILQQLCVIGSQTKIRLREVFLEYTKVSTSLRNSLDEALFSYHKGDFQNLTRISKQNNICTHNINLSRSSLGNKSGRSGCSKCNSNNGQRSQPRQNSSRFAFANDFMILNDKESDVSNTNRSKTIPKVCEKDIEDAQIHINDIRESLNHPVSLKVDSNFTQPSNKIDFMQNNYLYNSISKQSNSSNYKNFKDTFESLKKSRVSLNMLNKRQSIPIDSINSSKINESIISVLSSSNAIERIKRNRSELVNYYYNLKQKQNERDRDSFINLDRTTINLSDKSINHFEKFAESKKTPSFNERQLQIKTKSIGKAFRVEDSEVESMTNLSHILENNKHILSDCFENNKPSNTNRSLAENSKLSTTRDKYSVHDKEKYKYLNEFSCHSDHPSEFEDKDKLKGYDFSITHDPSNKENICILDVNNSNKNPYKRQNNEISSQKKIQEAPSKCTNEPFSLKKEDKQDLNQSYLSSCDSPNRSAILNYYSKNSFIVVTFVEPNSKIERLCSLEFLSKF